VPGETVQSLAVDPDGDLFAAYQGKDDVAKLTPAGAPLCSLDVDGPTAVATAADGSAYALDTADIETISVRKFDSACAEVRNAEFPFRVPFSTSTGIATSSACGIPGHDLYVSKADQANSFIRAYGPAPTDIEACPPPAVPPTIADQFALSVGAEDATLGAKINPHFWADTVYYVQYGSAECSLGGCASEPLGPVDLTDAVLDAELAAEVELSGLQPATTYHFRFVASSGGGGPVFGPDGTFTTFPLPSRAKTDCPNQQFRTGPSALLPDCRAYEMVSPLDKNNSDIATDEVQFSFDSPNFHMASLQGDRATYSSFGAFGSPKSAPFHSQLLSSRDPGAGWSTHSISPPRTSVPFFPSLSHANTTQFKAFSEDLCRGWFIQDTDLQLLPGAAPGLPSIYRRDDGDCGEEGYGLISSVAPPGYPGEDESTDSTYAPQVQGISADGSRTLLRAAAVLTPDACTTTPGTDQSKGIYQLYLHIPGAGNGELRLISVLPSGDAACVHSSGGTAQGAFGMSREDSVHHALSADASAVFWSTSSTAPGNQAPASSGGAGDQPGPLYVRLDPEGPPSLSGSCAGAAPGQACTTQISAAPDTRFWGADPTGATALYTTGGGLYAYDVESETSTQVAATGVKGVMGYSTDLSRVYFASTAVLSGAAQNSEGDSAIDEQPNLYLFERGAGTTFVGTLTSADARGVVNHFGAPGPIVTLPDRRTARVSADGLHAAFTSSAPLTGYDNTDVASGEAAAEVFLYDAEAGGGAGELACISCNPSGARPQGRSAHFSGNFWAAAQIPGWEYQLHPTRALSADGEKLFFESFEALVLRDTNGKRDVYEWQRAGGEQECIEEIGAELYVPDAGGCLSLISSGQGNVDSDFFDASASGSDVFFATTDSLVDHDFGLMDVYDARVGGGFPPPPPASVPCQGDGCQGNPANPPAANSPGTSVFNGSPNLGRDWTPKAKRCPKGKRKVVRKGRARCVKRPAKRRRRAAQNREASR
ncbi:MAG TPA: hypothetical protein VNM89_07015, partial [Solirubrobacterales bacterium]|nr:hypothetical protein [Solirubrobacterales bacterium]